MKRSIFMLLVLGLWGCGDHTDYRLDSPSATRGADDHVTVTVAVVCEVVGSGDCKGLGGFCLTGTWQSSSSGSPADGGTASDAGAAGAPIDSVQVCHPGDLTADGSKDSVTLRSNLTIPHDPAIEISLSLTPQPGTTSNVVPDRWDSTTLPDP
jgi:hypothetical protein